MPSQWEQTFLGHNYDALRGISDKDWSNLWGGQHGIDPTTGGITGPGGRVPHPIALDVQQTHERAVFNARQGMMQAGINQQLGSLGVLSSFRPGGLAGVEAGTYDRLANLHFQRAAMTQPMNVLHDLERHEAFQARKDAKKAGLIQGIAGLGAAAASLIPGVGPAVGAGIMAMGQGLAAGQGGGGVPQYGMPMGQQQQGPGQMAPGQSFQQQGAPGLTQGGQGGAPQGGQPAGQPMQSTAGGPEQGGRGGAPGGAPGPSGGPGGGGPSGGVGGPGGAPGGGGGGPGGGGAMGMRVGSDGNFGPIAWAVKAANDPQPLTDMTQVMLSDMLADSLESDPDWRALDYAVSRQVALRAGMAA